MIRPFWGMALLVLLVAGCAPGPTEINKTAQEAPKQYDDVLNHFFAYARAGNIDGMLAVTSDVTVATMGRHTIEAHYRNDTSPALKQCGALAPGGDVMRVTKDETGTGPGWIYVKSCTNPELKNLRLQFVLLRERSKIVVTSVKAM